MTTAHSSRPCWPERRTTVQQSLISTPHALAQLSHGVETLATPLALTLGPGKGFVLNARSKNECEILTDSSTIARRVIRLPGRGSNLGAMMLRKMALELHERFGDGVATATVMVRAMLREANRLVAAGANPALMVRGIRLAVDAAVGALEAQARPVADEDELVALVQGVTGDVALSAVLGQMFDTMGEYATVIMQDMPRPGQDHEYIRGGKWDGYMPSRLLLPEGEAALILRNPLIVLADEELTTVAQVQPVLEMALEESAVGDAAMASIAAMGANTEPGAMAGIAATRPNSRPPLLIIARAISGEALTMLTANHMRGVLTIGLFVLSSGSTLVHGDLEDMAALTGGQVFSQITGSLTQHIQLEHFGRAQQVVLSENAVTIAGGSGAPRAIQQRVAEVRAELKNTPRAEDSNWDFLRVRLARLTGGIGVLKLGAYTEQELEIKKEQVRKALRVLEAAYDRGLVPGGGAAFLACLPALCRVREACRSVDEACGVDLLEVALKAPFLQIVRNHGEIHPPLALDAVQRLGPGYGFDALRGDYARMEERQLLDCLSVTRGVLEAATSLASMLITTDTIVFSK